MRRFAKNNKPIKTKRQYDHLVFSSKKHKEDRERGYQLISLEYIRVDVKPKEIPIPWSPFDMGRDEADRFADKFSRNFIFPHENDQPGFLSLKTVSRDEFVRSLQEHRQDASYYWGDSGKKRKDGSKILQKKKHEGLRDISFNLPPWISATMLRELKVSELVEGTHHLVSKLAFRIEERSGYKVVAAAIHPDSRHKLGFHFSYKTSENGYLLGRSADRKRGRKGLRCMGPSNMGVYNMSKVANLVINLKHRFDRKDWDDKNLSDFADIVIKKKYGEDFWGKCLEEGKMHVFSWNRKIYEEQYQQRYMANRVDYLRFELAKLEPFNPILAMDYPPPECLIHPLKKDDVLLKHIAEFQKTQREKRLKEIPEEQDMEEVPKEVNNDLPMEI